MSPLPDPTVEDPRRNASEAASGGTAQSRSDAWVDAESAASFPASDPPSDWAGADELPQQPSDQEMA